MILHRRSFFSCNLGCISNFVMNFFVLALFCIISMEDLVHLQMGDPSVEVTDESRDASQTSKAKAMEALSEGIDRVYIIHMSIHITHKCIICMFVVRLLLKVRCSFAM